MADVLCRCAACATKFKVDAKYAGKKARCPKCNTVVEVPTTGNEAASTSTTIVPTATAKAPPKVAPPAVPAPVPTPVPAPAPAPTPEPVAESQFPTINPLARKTSVQTRAMPPAPTFTPTFAEVAVPPTSRAEEPFAAEPIDPPAGAAPAADPFAIQIKPKSKTNTAVQTGSAVASGESTPRPKGKGKASSTPLIIAGIAVLVLLLGGGIGAAVFFTNNGRTNVAKNIDGNGKGSGKSAAAKGTGRLVVDWPETERKSGEGAIKIGRRTEPMLLTGELGYDLPPGEHTVFLQRRGYAPVTETVTIVKGETITVKPKWEKNEFGSSGPAVATKNAGSSGGTDFQVGMAEGPKVDGFEGFTQNFYRAKELAAKEQRDILVVFGRSDTDAGTKQLIQGIASAKSQVQAFVPVIVDLPGTKQGLENLQDLATNQALTEEFALRRIPTIVLLDHQARSYYLQDKWANGGPQNLAAYLQEGAAAKTERDQLWSAVKGESLEPAAKFVNWLIDKHLVTRFGDEIKQWMPAAKRLDPNNDQGQLEAFIEAQFNVDVAAVNEEDAAGIQQVVAPLAAYLETQRFKSEDRGARLHFRAAVLLGRSGQGDDAKKHLVRAGSYKPTDPDIVSALASAKTAIERGRILSTGTGFIVSEAGYIMTNHHVIGGRGKVMVRMPDGETTVEGTVIASDEDRDMAIVKVSFPEGTQVKPIAISPKAIGRGIDVAAFGYPLANSVKASLKFTKGGVSALPDASNDQMFTLDLRVNPGNSGGPLCDQRGNVVGMVTAKTRTNFLTGEDSYGMAIPSPDLVKFLDKHLPAGTPRAAPVEAGDAAAWSDVDAQVSPGVLLILKME